LIERNTTEDKREQKKLLSFFNYIVVRDFWVKFGKDYLNHIEPHCKTLAATFPTLTFPDLISLSDLRKGLTPFGHASIAIAEERRYVED
jgi:hypothetical protein